MADSCGDWALASTFWVADIKAILVLVRQSEIVLERSNVI